MPLSKCDVRGVDYERKYLQDMDQVSIRMAGAPGFKDTVTLWDLYLNDPATRPILDAWLDVRKRTFGATLKHSHMTLRPAIVNLAFDVRLQSIMLKQEPPVIGEHGVDEKSIATFTCLWYCFKLLKATPDLFNRIHMNGTPIHIDPYDITHAYKLLSRIFGNRRGARFLAVEDLFGLSSAEIIRTMDNAVAVGTLARDEDAIATPKLDVVAELTDAIYPEVDPTKQFAAPRACVPVDRLDILRYLLEIDRFEQECVVGNASRGTSTAILEDAGRTPTETASDISNAIESKLSADADIPDVNSDPVKSESPTANNPTSSNTPLLKLAHLIDQRTMVGAEPPPCEIVTIELTNPADLIKAFNPNSTRLDQSISRVNAKHDLIDQFRDYGEKEDRAFSLYYASTTLDPAASYLAMDTPKLKYLLKILHDEGAFNATFSARVLWVTEMFLNSLSMPFVTVWLSPSMKAAERKTAIKKFTAIRNGAQILLTNFNCRAKSLTLHTVCSRMRLFEAIGAIHRPGQKQAQKVWLLFQNRTFSRWVEGNNTLNKVGWVAARMKKSPNLAPRPPLRNRWRLPPPTSPVKWPLPRHQPLAFPRHFPNQDLRPKRSRFSRFFRYIFGPHAGRRARLRLWSFRHETLPAFRHRAQARVYQVLVQRQARLARRAKNQGGRLGLKEFLVGQKRRRRRGVGGLVGGLLVPFEKTAHEAGKRLPGAGKGAASMSDYEPSSSSTWSSGYGYGGRREPGARRKKMFEYLKAANDLRQSYAASWTAQRNASRDLGDEYMNTPGAFPDVEIARSGDEEMLIFPSYARRLDQDRMKEMKRQQRRDSTDTIDEYHGLDGAQEHEMSEWDTFDDENAVVAVDVRGWVYAPYRGPMTRKQRLVVALARRLSGVPAPTNNETGLDGTSQDSERLPRMTEKREEELVDTEAQSIIRDADKGNELNWKGASGALEQEGRGISRAPTTSSMQSTQSTQLSKDELSVANAHLMERIRPFLSNPMAGMAVTVFFFNDENSQSRNIMTNDSGHFSIRASLSFVPTHVRVLASEDLSAVKEIKILESSGHSAIANGAKEMCKNVFVRELSDLTIEGLGVDIHYVSNAPWQLYPLLDRFFKMYSGMLQGIFEPTMERKKGALEQILQDFPDRQFILVGDSGEADLEVYTDLVMANPGRIIGVFIRDITTPERTNFFEKSINHLEHKSSPNRSNTNIVDHSDTSPNRPNLPPRPPRMASDSVVESKSAETEDLIDLSDEPEKSLKTPPTIPTKPSSLRSVTNSADLAERPPIRGPIQRKPAPPLPRRSGGSGSLSPATRSDSSVNSKDLPIHSRPSPHGGDGAWASKHAPAPPPPRRSNTGASAMSSSSQSSTNTSRTERQPRYPTSSTTPTSRSSSPGHLAYPPPPSALRSPASNPSLSSRTSTNSDNYPPSRASTANSAPRAPLPNKREELWRRRWERATEILADQGVVLGSWRVGKDAKDVSMWLVKEALKESSMSKSKDKIREKEREMEREKERNKGDVWSSQ
ncbi:uncharacterized protein BDV14DRAFT_190863 [Aspergillus stella-maris]|uniref:uncharacterized protein n=1 Tax=Aspergillus stella-maris TaxID=1810926 RepID=UPI003CCDEA75